VTVQDSCTLQIVEALDACGIPYLLSGSFASNFYGIPRSTKDADFVIQSKGVGSEFEKKLGNDFLLDPQLTFETVTGTYKQLVRHAKRNFRIEIFLLSDDPHDRERLRAVSRKTCLVEKFGCFQQKIQSSVNYAGRAEKTKTISGILSPSRRVDSIGLILKNGATSMGHLHCYNKSGDLCLIFEV
jgi:hypothetical protein